MKQRQILAICAATICCANLASGGTMTVGSAAPAVDAADIASLGGTVDIGGNTGHAWSNRPRQGQTFTTGSSPGGYFLDAYTVRVQVNQASTTSANWELRLGTVDAGGNFTATVTENVAGVEIPQSVAGNDFPSYLTFAFDAPITLDANTQYGIDLFPDGGGFISLNDDTDPYAGGAAMSSGSPGSGAFPENPLTLHASADRAFHVNLAEVAVADGDGDGLPDDWETENGLDPDDNGEDPNNNGVPGNPDNGPLGDPDMDGLNNLGELNRGSDPQDVDSDDDMLTDKVETKTGIFVDAEDTGSDPNVADTDGDGLDDKSEVDPNPHVTDPNLADTDGDTISDFAELEEDPFVTDPTMSDSDGDGFDDGLELSAGSDPTNPADIPAVAAMFVSPNPPTVDGEDIAQLVGESDLGGDQGHAWSNRPRQGQSFTTGANPGGYTLTAITFRARVNQASTTSDNWELRFGPIDGTGAIAPTVTENIAGVTIPNGNQNWITWAFATPVELDPGTSYGFDVFPDGSGFISLGELGDVYAGGSAYSAGSPGSAAFPDSPPNPVTAHDSDHAFHANLLASAGGGFQITEISLVDTPDGKAVRLTWESRTGRTYNVDASTDMTDWESEVEDSIPADGETTTIERLIANLPVSGPRIFFRVELAE